MPHGLGKTVKIIVFADGEDATLAREAGADYISFGPCGQNDLGDGNLADTDLFQWWSQMIEVPVVAEGSISLETAEKLAPFTDFFALGQELWTAKSSPADALSSYLERIL